MKKTNIRTDLAKTCEIDNSCAARGCAYLIEKLNQTGRINQSENIYLELHVLEPKITGRKHTIGQGIAPCTVSSWLISNRIFGKSLSLRNRKTTVRKAAEAFKDCGPVLLATRNHVTVVDNGEIIDTFDCGNMVVTDVLYVDSKYKQTLYDIAQ